MQKIGWTIECSENISFGIIKYLDDVGVNKKSQSSVVSASCIMSELGICVQPVIQTGLRTY